MVYQLGPLKWKEYVWFTKQATLNGRLKNLMSCLAMHKKQAVNENPMYYAQNLLPSSSGCRTFFIVAYKIAALRHCRKKAETLTA